MLLQFCYGFMMLQMCITERHTAIQTGLEGHQCRVSTDITWHTALCSRRLLGARFHVHRLFELSSQIRYEGINTKLWPFAEFFLTERAGALLTAVPIFVETDHAEVVSTWCRNRLSEDFQTDGALQLLF